MATVTSYTAERMKAIEDSAIVDGNVVGDNLILVRYDEETINAGSVRGPQGIQGPTGPTGPQGPIGLTGATGADSTVPGPDGTAIGTIHMFAGATAPTGYLLVNGAAVSRTTYAALFGVIGTTYGVGDGSTTFNLPNLTERFPAGVGSASWAAARGVNGGSPHSTLPLHGHTGWTSSAPDHTHAHARPSIKNIALGTGANGATNVSDSSQPPDQTGSAGNHVHTFGTTNEGSSAANTNLPPYLILNFIIRY